MREEGEDLVVEGFFAQLLSNSAGIMFMLGIACLGIGVTMAVTINNEFTYAGTFLCVGSVLCVASAMIRYKYG
jgi:hypothetical protein